MVLLLALPVIVIVAVAHRYLLLFAPSNVLIRRVRAARPTWRAVAVMLAIAASLMVATKVLSDTVSAGAPGWVNLVVLVLAWDAIKVSCSAVGVALRVASFAMARIGGLLLRGSNGARGSSTWPTQIQP